MGLATLRLPCRPAILAACSSDARIYFPNPQSQIVLLSRKCFNALGFSQAGPAWVIRSTGEPCASRKLRTPCRQRTYRIAHRGLLRYPPDGSPARASCEMSPSHIPLVPIRNIVADRAGLAAETLAAATLTEAQTLVLVGSTPSRATENMRRLGIGRPRWL